MWFSEVHRIGFQKCTPWGYRLLEIGDLSFFATFVGTLGVLFVTSAGWIEFSLWYLLILSGFVVAGIVAKTIANTLADGKNFEYRYEPDEAVWGPDQSQRFTHAEWERDYKPLLRRPGRHGKADSD